jgi:thiol-disulfide isomerase/thioredoxin
MLLAELLWKVMLALAVLPFATALAMRVAATAMATATHKVPLVILPFATTIVASRAKPLTGVTKRKPNAKKAVILLCMTAFYFLHGTFVSTNCLDMSPQIIFFQLLLYCLLGACSPGSGQVSTSDTPPSYVIITGTIKNAGFNQPDIKLPDPFEMSLSNLQYLEQRTNDNQFYVKFRCDSTMKLLLFLKDVWVQPGDSVHVDYTVLENSSKKYRDTLVFSGNNLAGYVIYPYISPRVMYQMPGYPFSTEAKYKKDSAKYQADLSKFTQMQQIQVNDLLQKHNATATLTSLIKSNLKYNRLLSLFYYKNFNHLPVDNRYKDSFACKPFDTRGYFNAIRLYQMAAAYKKGITENSPEYYQSLFAVANEFSGLDKEFLYLNTVLQLPKINQAINPTLINAINDSMTALMQTSLVKARFLQKLGKPGNMNNADVILTNLSGDELNFDEMLKKYAGKAIYLDFWASWCVPCRAEFPQSRKLIAQYNDVAYVFVSIDADETAWKKAVDKESLPKANCYRLNKAGYEAITQRFGFTGIPYYALYNPMGNLTIKNAPRPSDNNVERVLQSVIGTGK